MHEREAARRGIVLDTYIDTHLSIRSMLVSVLKARKRLFRHKHARAMLYSA
jgi:hypothetical protein